MRLRHTLQTTGLSFCMDLLGLVQMTECSGKPEKVDLGHAWAEMHGVIRGPQPTSHSRHSAPLPPACASPRPSNDEDTTSLAMVSASTVRNSQPRSDFHVPAYSVPFHQSPHHRHHWSIQMVARRISMWPAHITRSVPLALGSAMLLSR